MKMLSTKDGWYIIDNGVIKFFENSRDAWMYVFFMKDVKSHTTVLPHSLYPVKSLDPRPSSMAKRVTLI